MIMDTHLLSLHFRLTLRKIWMFGNTKSYTIIFDTGSQHLPGTTRQLRQLVGSTLQLVFNISSQEIRQGSGYSKSIKFTEGSPSLPSSQSHYRNSKGLLPGEIRNKQ